MEMLKRLSDNFFYYPFREYGDRPNIGIVNGNEKTLIIDAGNSISHASDVDESLFYFNIKTPDYLLITHWHWDHILGMENYNIPSFASIYSKKYFDKLSFYRWNNNALENRLKNGEEIHFCFNEIKKEHPYNNRRIKIKMPQIYFKEYITFDLGDVNVIFKHVGGDHSEDSSIAYIVEDKILFLGDCLYPNLYSEKWHYNIERLENLIKKINEFDAEIFIPSHGDPMDKIEFDKMISDLIECSLLIRKYGKNYRKIKKNYNEEFNRELPERLKSDIAYFING